MHSPASTRLIAIALLLVVGAWDGARAGLKASDMLDGAALRRLIKGKRVYLAAPLGGEFPLFYRADGIVDGTGEALGLGKFLKPSDQGRWWVESNRLCQRWASWYDGKIFCFTARQTGPTAIEWQRDDGFSGSARIASQ
jgi:hypothetical protein